MALTKRMLNGILTFTIFLANLCTQSFGQGTASDYKLTFEVNEGFSDTFVGNVKQSSYFQTKFEKALLDSLVLGLQNSQHAHLFKIADTTGVIRTAKTINREDFCPMKVDCFLYVDVVISQPVAYLQAVKASIKIADMNDDIPRFTPAQIALNFPENAQAGTARSLELALDYDSPQFGVKRYELISDHTDTFKLQSSKTTGSNPVFNSLQLILQGPLDREKVATYTMLVAAYDTPTDDLSRRGILTIAVNIDDDNDNAPTFINSSYELYISENTTPIQKIIQVQAIDEDKGANARISYHFTPATLNSHGQIFSVNNQTGEVFLKGVLDYETTKLYNLQVIAKDAGIVPLTSTADIIIHVTDQNDNTPQIKINTFGAGFSAKISESSPVNTFVAQVSVFDSDSGSNGQIVCALPHPSFTLESLTGANQFKVVTKVKLDREQQEIYSLHITCTDQGQTPKTVTETLVVSLIDENDNRPILPKSKYDIYIYENNKIGDVILQLNATDADKGENGRISYKISQGEISKLISINENTGTIRAKIVFDYEGMKTINFHVTVKDHGNSSNILSIPVTVHIQDVNDVAPVFDKQIYQFKIPENDDPHKQVGQVYAVDTDEPPFNKFRFSIPNEYSSIPFYVHQDSGVLTASDTFDRETKDAYHFELLVTDLDKPILSSTSTVIVTVTDVNDNIPSIVYPPADNSTVHISNEVPVGTPVISVQVTDADTDINTNITFSLQELDLANSDDASFKISASGTIETNKDFKSLSYKEFNILVTVEDKGLPPLSSSQKVTIIVDNNIPYSGSREEEQSGSNVHIIVSVSVVSAVIVLGLIIAIAVIKGRACKRRPKDKYNGPYSIDPNDLKADIPPPAQQADSQAAEQGFSNLAYTGESGVPVSLHPSGQKGSRSTSPDSLLYDLKLEKVQTQKAYLGQLKVVDHDTSSSGSTDDSGRGPSEEGGDILARQSPFNDSSEYVPNLHEQFTHKKTSIKSAKPIVISKPQVKVPPSYETYMRNKANRPKRVNFALTEEEEPQTESSENINMEELPHHPNTVNNNEVRDKHLQHKHSSHNDLMDGDAGYVFMKHKEGVKTLPSSSISSVYQEPAVNTNASSVRLSTDTTVSHMSSTVV